MHRIVPLTLAALTLVPASARADRLPLERLFQDPALAGPTVRDLKISPDGSRITFLQGRPDDKDRMDLWEFRPSTGERRLLVDSRALVPEEGELSDAEKDRRERERIAALSGIVSYDFSEDGQFLLFPLGGDLYVVDLDSGEPRQVTGTEAAETDPRLSPHGSFVAFIRDRDLYTVDLRTGRERRLTGDGGGAIGNGVAEFVAQEEMGRSTGYWWAPDESAIAFIRIDESGVDLARRSEIYADGIRIRKQRYPYAGTANATVRLGVVSLPSGDVRWMDLGGETDVYLARVDWFPDARHLAVQVESRDQTRLELRKVDAATGSASLLLAENGDPWVEIRDDLTFLHGSPEFLWSSARSGYRHLYLYRNDGALVRPLTSGEWSVTARGWRKACLGVDEEARKVYFLAAEKSPLERHLYATSLDTETPETITRITAREGWHRVTVSPDCRFYVDDFSSPETPPQVSVHRMDGSRIAFLEENALDRDHPYFPYLEDHRLPRFGTLTAADGQTLYYRLTTPAGFDPKGRYPAVVLVYGGPLGQGVRKAWGSAWEQVLTQDGYVVFQLDNRGTGGRGVAFDAPIHGQLGKVECVDQAEGVRFLTSLPYVDPDRVGISGWSYGGYMVLMMLLRHPGMFAAGAAGAPVTDWRLYDTHYTERYLMRPRENPAGYDASDVLPYVKALESPLLVVHGMADDNVLFVNSTRLFQALQEADKPFEMMTYPGRKHGLTRRKTTGLHAMGTIKRFLDRHLKAAPVSPSGTRDPAGG